MRFIMLKMNLSDLVSPYLESSEAKSLDEAVKLEPKRGLFLNQSRLGRDAFLSLFPKAKPHPLVKNGVIYQKEDYELGKHLLFDLGAYYIQDPSAMMVASFLPPLENGYVLDMAAAPGGKTIGYAFANPTATILANDISYIRASELSSNVERMGLGNIAVTSGDWKIAYSKYRHFFDRIILDAPCSGSAMFRKNEAAKEDWSQGKVEKNAAIQAELLGYAYEMLSPGGYLIYSTCSFSKEENQDQILSFLRQHEDMEIVPLKDDPSFFHPSSLKEAILLLPTRGDYEGQFIALLHKKGEPTDKKLKVNTCPSSFLRLAKEYGIEDFSYLDKGRLYCLNRPLPISSLSLLRYGICVEEEGKPSFALARYLGKAKTIELNEKEALAYLHGDLIPLQGENGFHPVSYQLFPLGQVKIVNGQGKNHYPKGYRHQYQLPLFRLG